MLQQRGISFINYSFINHGELPMTEPPPIPGQVIHEGQGRIFPCEECGADLKFHIGDQKLKCPYCGAVKEIELKDDAEIREQNFNEMLEVLQKRRESQEEVPAEHNEVRCESCGSNVLFQGTLTSTECPYCGSPLQREKIHRGGFRIPVDAVLPFKVDSRKVEVKIVEWVKSRWFAPNDFKKRGAEGRVNGAYLPFWTFDTLTFTAYTGERGENYTETVGIGDKKRTVTKTRWYSAAGKFQRFFDDVLINGSRSMVDTHIDELSPWPLQDCLPFTPEVLAGHFARTYDIELAEAFPIAKKIIDSAIYSDCKNRIGGDEQRVHSVKSRYDAITFKHVLLPVYTMVYRYKEKSYGVMVNAATGAVHGSRPYSWVKITLTLLSVIALGLTFAAIANS